ncbi:MAG: hypothetical protein JOY56_03135 [Solirubrobacterales bacterium]|nr:hypothetical protein [Solirubrobacterales bacterium]MBV9362810.1 hypothetical protein [Solirubrobacterales bacterium]MBV9683701.1 hypothetical protein [Solirubrobacterales bacterium]MBV9806568.1 hypothetical protein [Solirubrobacterales bacterium]
MAGAIRRGDVVLVDELGQGLVSASIALGELLRYGRGSPYTQWTHSAIVCDVPFQDPSTISIVEARAATGVRRALLSKYEKHYAIVHTDVDDCDWPEVERFLKSVRDARESYDFVAYAGLTLYALTGSRICIQRAGTATCAGLVADALTRAGFIWSRPPYAMTPADIAADLEDGKHTITSKVVDEGQTTLCGRMRQLASTMLPQPRR